MNLKDTILIAADTPRSNAYVQAIAQCNIKINGTILFGEDSSQKLGQTKNFPSKKNIETPYYVPDFSISLLHGLNNVCDNIERITAAHVNDAIVERTITEFDPKLIIYSGYGSQLVGRRLLEKGIPFLHIHAGWLPEFRGSTTTYYHLLETERCGVSAILLANDIDTGPIIARKWFSKPPSGLNIDYLYDSAIRADLLADVLTYYGKNGRLPDAIEQNSEDGNTYYVIHPLLKHIAMLSIK
jgi:methionyl-tRNA formyltransferase